MGFIRIFDKLGNTTFDSRGEIALTRNEDNEIEETLLPHSLEPSPSDFWRKVELEHEAYHQEQEAIRAELRLANEEYYKRRTEMKWK